MGGKKNRPSTLFVKLFSPLQIGLGVIGAFAVLFTVGGLIGLGLAQMRHETSENAGLAGTLLMPETKTGQTGESPAERVSAEVPPPRLYAQTILLPKPSITGGMPLHQVFHERRSRREFSDKPVSMKKLSQLLWSAQGISDPEGKKRTAPSAYEVYPISMFAVVRNVSGLEPGLYEYLPETHALGNLLMPNAGAQLDQTNPQDVVKNAPVVLVAAAAYGKGVELMQEHAKSSAILEVGHIGQNVYLQAESLKMATVVVAGFNPEQIGKALGLDLRETVIYLIPVGERASSKN